MTNFGCGNPRPDAIMVFDFANCADKWLRRAWRVAIAGRETFVTELSMYPSCALYCKLTAFHVDMELLTSSCMLPPAIAASCFTYIFSMHELDNIFGGSNCNVAVDKLVSPLL